MATKEFELFHGAVITRLIRAEQPVTLRLLETHPKEKWSTYTLNDAVDLVVTYSKSPRVVSRGTDGTSWTFVFSANQLKQITSTSRPVYAALVCGRKTIGNEAMHVCLLNPEQLMELVDAPKPSQSLTVRKPDSKGKLRVFKDRVEKLLVAQNAIDTWEIPS